MDSTDQDIDARFAELQLIEQLEARERQAQSYLEQNAELRVEVAKLAANVAAMRDATPPAADLVN
jgi:hypothetical protein